MSLTFNDADVRAQLTNIPGQNFENTYRIWTALREAWEELKRCMPDKDGVCEVDLYDVYPDEDVLRDLNNKLNYCMENQNLRRILYGDDTVDVLSSMLNPSLVPLSTDLSSLGDAPVTSLAELDAYLGNGLIVDLRLISSAMLWGYNTEFTFKHPYTRVAVVYNSAGILTEERLRTLYDAYIKLLRRWRENDTVGAKELDRVLNLHTSPAHYLTRIWMYLCRKYGYPLELLDEGVCDVNFKFSGFSLDTFSSHFTSFSNEVVRFMEGGRGYVGFKEELKALTKAVEARDRGEEFAAIEFISEDSRASRIMCFKVSDVLDVRRVGGLAKAVAKGREVMRMEHREGDRLVHEGDTYHLDRMEYMGLMDKEYVKVYDYLENLARRM